MVHVNNRTNENNLATAKPYGVFQELDKEKKYFNFDDIRTNIEK